MNDWTQVKLNLCSVDDYRMFLRIKELPRYSFNGRVALFPAEYARLLGVEASVPVALKAYRPIKGLFDYQAGTVRTAIAKRKFAAFIGCGLGKTLVMTEFVRYVESVMPADRCHLIVSPLMVVRQTLGEVERFYGKRLKVSQVRSRELSDFLMNGTGIGITNYEAITDELKPGRLASLILDESAMLKNAYGKWGTRLIELGRGLDWKLCLTGLPAPNDRIEYANHAVFLDQFPTVNSFLARFFVNRGQTDNRWELKSHALKAFYRQLSHWSVFINNPGAYGWKDNVANTPPIRVHIDDVVLSSEQWQAASAESKALFPVAGGITSRAKLAQIAKGYYNGEKIESAKPAYIQNLVSQWPSESTIIWCRFNREQEQIASLFPGCANVSGDTPEDERTELIADFQAGRRRVLVSKAKVLGFGLNLQVCTRMIFSTLQDSLEEYHQCVKRANRYGSTMPLHVFLPITEIERPMIETVLRKARMVEEDTAEQERLFKEYGNAA